MSFIFGGDTGKSYEDIKRQRAIADRLVASQGKAPRNVGEGLTAIGNALAARSLGKKAEARSAELDAEWAETAGGFGIDPARMEIIKNLPYEQRQMYMLNYMDKQDALRRRGSGSGTGKADAQAALVAQLLAGGSQAGAAPATADVGGFDMAQAVTGSAPLQMPDFQPGTPVEQTPMLDQKGMTPTQMDYNSELMAQYAPPAPDVAAALVPPAPQPAPLPDISAPIAMPEQPEQGLSFNLPEAQPQQQVETNEADALIADINRLYEMQGQATDAATRKAVNTAISQQMERLEFLQTQDKLRAKAEGEGTEYGLTPQYGTDADGNIVLIQLGKDGTAIETPLPEGVAISRGIEKLDLGTHFQHVNKFTGEKIGDPIPKNLREAAEETAEGSAQGKENVESKKALDEMERNLPGLFVVADQLDKLADAATYTKGGQAYNELVKQVGGEPTPGAIARAKYIAVVDNQVLPLLKQTFGAAFTAKEGDTLRDTLGDPDKSPQEKKAVLNAFISQKIREVQSRGGNVPEQLPDVITDAEAPPLPEVFNSDAPPSDLGLSEEDADLWKYATPDERRDIWGSR